MASQIINIGIENMKDIFPIVEGVDMEQLKITSTGVFSVSKSKASNMLSNLIEKYFNTTDITITDGTANNGSDTIALALRFKHVNAIELSEAEFSVLENNVNAYNLKNITLFNDDSLKIIPTVQQDLIYFDAPWGGTNYKKFKTLRLYINNKEIAYIYNEFKNHANVIVFKVPKNYDFGSFIKNTSVTQYSIYPYKDDHDRIKFYFIFAISNK